jgi:DNA-binding FrmR family transcriptional regulator
MDSINAAFNRIEGQVRGVKKMYEEGRECAAIAQQIAAIQSALKRVGRELLTAEATKCVELTSNHRKIEDIVESLIKIS